MSLRKDKEKVLGEHFDDERIKSFFTYDAPAGIDPDYHLLEKAYRGMRGENFATFLTFFKAEGRDINAKSPEGQTLLQVVSTHRTGEEYAIALKNAGACE